jgi:hypothetical protein
MQPNGTASEATEVNLDALLCAVFVLLSEMLDSDGRPTVGEHIDFGKFGTGRANAGRSC